MTKTTEYMKPLIEAEELDSQRRRLCVRIAASIIKTMADTDTDIDVIASRLGINPELVSTRLAMLTNGVGISLNEISDLLIAMGHELNYRSVNLTKDTMP